MGQRAAGYQRVALLTEAAGSYMTRKLMDGFVKGIGASPSCAIKQYNRENAVCSAALALDILSSEAAPEAIFTSNYSRAETVDDIRKRFFPQKKLDVYTISHLFTMPEVSYQKYELNYRLLGKAAAEQLIQRLEGKAQPYFQDILLPETGFRSWNPGPVPELSLIHI